MTFEGLEDTRGTDWHLTESRMHLRKSSNAKDGKSWAPMCTEGEKPKAPTHGMPAKRGGGTRIQLNVIRKNLRRFGRNGCVETL